MATAGCATLGNGTSQRIQVVSEPPGAEVFIAGRPVGTTPTEVVVSRRQARHHFRVGSEARWVERGWSPWAALKIPFGFLAAGWGVTYISDAGDSGIPVRHGMAVGFVPIVVDLLTGGAWEFPRRLYFSPQGSALRQQLLPQQPMRPVQPHGDVPLRDVELRRGLRVRALLNIPQLHHLAEGRWQVVDGGEEEAP